MGARLQSRLDQKNKAVLYRITLAQFAVTMLLALLLYALSGMQAAYSALLAGSISTCATFFTGVKFFFTTARSPRERLARVYTAELLKILFLAVAFSASIMLARVHFPAFIGAYLATVAVYWLAMVWPVFGVQIKTN